jgi:hypothetical protein
MQSAPPSGGAGTLTISTSRDCTWAASSAVSWIVITSGSSGQGDGSAAYRIAANTEAAQRRGNIEVNSTQVAITQDAACRYEVTASTTAVPAEGGTVAVNVQSAGTCGWTAASQVAWITVAEGSDGSGSGSVTLKVAGNGGASRTGTVLVAGQTITITQGPAQSGPPPPPPPPSCDSSISPSAQAFGADAGSGTVTVTIAASCSWTAVANVDWLSVVSGASGTGPGQVRFNVAANSAASTRQGNLTIAGRMFSVAQAGISCGYAIPAPASASFTAAGGNGSFVVATNNACSWTAKSEVNWITITSSATGHGSTTISFAVAANTGVARTGTVTVEGQTFTVSQAAPCAYAVTTSAQSFPDVGGNASATITTDGACAWTAASNASWIAITSAASGTGNATVAFTVAANTGAARTGTLTIAGQAVTLSQAAAATCSYTIAPPSQSMPDTGGANSVAVTASAASCQWTAVSNAAWITITAGATATGSQSVAYTVAANTGAARSGTLSIAGQTFTVDQAAAPPPPPPPPCTYSIAPGGQAAAASGGTGSVAVTASAASCAWTAASAVDWIAITAPGPGQGNGTVEFTIAANAGPPRSGTLTVAGQVFTVNQDGASMGGP